MQQRELVKRAKGLREEMVRWHGRAGATVDGYVAELHHVRQELDKEMEQIKIEVAHMRDRIRIELRRCDAETALQPP